MKFSKISAPDLAALARRAEWVVWVAVMIYLSLPCVLWMVPGLAEKVIVQRLGLPPDLTAGQRLGACLASILYAAPLAYGVSRIAFLLRLVRLGQVFSPEAVRHVRHLGFSLVTAAALLPVTRWLVLAAIGHPAEAGYLLGVFSPAFAVLNHLLLGVAVLVLASVLKEAVRLSEENAHFV